MFKKSWIIFLRDIKVNSREFITMYIMSAPILFAIVINLLTPSINDTTVNLALIEGENNQLQAYMEDFAKVTVYDDKEAIEERVGRRDDVFGVLSEGDSYYVLRQGDEMDELVDFSKMLVAFYEEGVDIEDTTAVMNSFGREEPPLKRLLVIIFMMFTSIMGGMLIAINIIEEKADKSIHAISLTPISRNGYLMGKSLIGALFPIIGSVLLVLITGYTDINWGMMLVLVFASTLISIMVGFIQGINNETVMDAAGSVKMMFLPMGGAVAIAELVSDKWQWVAYWVPFYWTYQGMNEVLTYNGKWGNTLLYTGIVIVITVVVYLLMMPKIRKGLS